MKYLIWLLIVVAVVTWFKRFKAGLSNSHGNARGSSTLRETETMRQCAHCGIHIPASEAVTDGAGAIFCCEEHRVQYVAR